MAKDQKEILFLFGKSRESIEAGPYLGGAQSKKSGSSFAH
jgi:hypothetical protein